MNQEANDTLRIRRPSPYLRQVKVPGGALTYHSLFGNLSFLDQELTQLLATAEREEVADLLPKSLRQLLYNKYFITDVAEDEREVTRQWLRQRESAISSGYYLRALQISASNACNFSCSYCFADATDRRRRELGDGTRSISLELAQRAILTLEETAARNGHHQIAVKFLGREPLVNWRVINQLLRANRGKEIVWALTTNGSLVTAEIAEELCKHAARVVVSIDGEPWVHNSLRVLKSGRTGSFEQAWRGLELLSMAGCSVSVSSVVTSLTRFEDLRRFIDRLAGRNIRELELTLVMQTVHGRAQEGSPSIEELSRQLVQLYRYARGVGIVLHGDWVDPFHRLLLTKKLRTETDLTTSDYGGCSATSHQISIEPSGELFPCRAMATHYGGIDDLEGVLRSESYRSVLMRTYYNVPYCKDCRIEGFCQGTCLGACEEGSNDIYLPQEAYCEVYRRCSELLLRDLDQHRNDLAFKR
jgi:uncharacterized protein